ncbi:TPA: hypothetical protein ACXR0B_001994 [Klebsiella variicola subsp. variicola]|uniref:hypothetical protein n=1 Tax=Klebsiella TaxID=570 RepID=UPI00115AC1D2|nr:MULTISPECIES: hypothetical protein [Klebsiella]EKZ5806921.1 hypothetical protein [Klebsiella variicola]EKZ9690400.1 hypothetical protein [Klebsiella pneumoniae]EKZ9879435.1 hypothetical protein [Klebsiella pneumoniae]ELA0009054.1 hypothetical protein [Klebsiella pneumoniae]ELA0120465.1 hypothetical protein [Klebsiella pneumoniae]
MNKTLIVIIAFGLVGCKSLDYVRSTTPVLKGETSKSVADFTACVSSKWSGSGGYLTSLPIHNGISLQVPHPMGGYDVVLDATKSAAGTDFILYERVASLTSSSYESSVNICK